MAPRRRNNQNPAVSARMPNGAATVRERTQRPILFQTARYLSPLPRFSTQTREQADTTYRSGDCLRERFRMSTSVISSSLH
jgi:hypothetical protein